MRADFSRDDIDDALPIRARLGIEPEREKRIGWRSPIPENPRALLAADSHGLMPLNGAEMIWNRRGHVGELQKIWSYKERFPKLGRFETIAADTQSALTSLRETLSDDVSMEG